MTCLFKVTRRLEIRNAIHYKKFKIVVGGEDNYKQRFHVVGVPANHYPRGTRKFI